MSISLDLLSVSPPDQEIFSPPPGVGAGWGWGGGAGFCSNNSRGPIMELIALDMTGQALLVAGTKG